MSKKQSEEKAEAATPRTSGGPEAFAAPDTPSNKADREAALQHAQRHLARQAEINPPETQHSMTRGEMQAAGITDEALVYADRNGIRREALLATPEIAEEIDRHQAALRELQKKA